MSSLVWAPGAQSYWGPSRGCVEHNSRVVPGGVSNLGYFSANSGPLTVESTYWGGTRRSLWACLTGRLKRFLRQAKALDGEMWKPGDENCLWIRLKVMSKVPTPFATAALLHVGF